MLGRYLKSVLNKKKCTINQHYTMQSINLIIHKRSVKLTLKLWKWTDLGETMNGNEDMLIGYRYITGSLGSGSALICCHLSGG